MTSPFLSPLQTPIYVYYESLCPDSQAFVTKQLYPTMKNLKDFVDLKLIPFGKSSYKTQGSETLFDCHHGEIECYGNKIHACAISHIQVDSFQNEHTRESLIVDYITCLMSGVSKDESYASFAKDCADRTRVKKFDSIENCANSTEGSDLLKEMGELTNKFEYPLKSVPTITIREVSSRVSLNNRKYHVSFQSTVFRLNRPGTIIERLRKSCLSSPSKTNSKCMPGIFRCK